MVYCFGAERRWWLGGAAVKPISTSATGGLVTSFLRLNESALPAKRAKFDVALAARTAVPDFADFAHPNAKKCAPGFLGQLRKEN